MKHTPIKRLEKLLQSLEGAYAPNTLRAYEADMLEFIEWCYAKCYCALPAKSEQVADFLIQTTQHHIKASTIRRKAFSISAIHRLSDLPDPTIQAAVRIAFVKSVGNLAPALNRPIRSTDRFSTTC